MKNSRLRELKGPAIAIVVVATFFGFIAIPNLLTAWNRSRQKRSMADMRSLATALEARASDLNSYAIGSAASQTATEFSSLTRVPMVEVERALIPKYLRKPLRRDGWDNDFEIRIGAKAYAIRSRGSDGRADPEIRFNHVITSFKEDLVFSNGNFIQYPEGICTQ